METSGFDAVVVGSGVGGLVTALRAHALGLRPVVLEKGALVGGTTAWSGGAFWAPDNPVMRAHGVPDSPDDAARYLASVVGSSAAPERQRAYVEHAGETVAFLIDTGIPFVYSDGTSDYYPEAPGGHVRGRTLHAEVFDTRELGAWERWFRPQQGGISQRIVLRSLAEAPPMTIATRSVASARVAARVLGRTLRAAATGAHLVGMGQALAARLVHAVTVRGIEIRRECPVTGLLTAPGGRVVGVVTPAGEVPARHGVVLAAGGYARHAALRAEHRPGSSPDWSAVIEEDTGDLLEAATALGAATALLDEAIWTPMSVPPDGVPIPHLWERSLPGSIMVDSSGRRFVNEATSYMAVGQAMFARHSDTGAAIPSWLVFDATHRRRFPLGAAPPGLTPRSWITEGYLHKARDLAGIAASTGIDVAGLRAQVTRFNAFAADGVDRDFGRGESHHDRIFADPRTGPNPCLGPLRSPPYYAVALYPGDVSTVGGLVTDGSARVLRADGSPVPGLYATGSSAASALGRVYPASGCSIGSAAVFGHLAAEHMADSAGAHMAGSAGADLARQIQGTSQVSTGGGDHGD